MTYTIPSVKVDTTQGSHERARIISLHKKLRTNHTKTIKPETVPLERWEP